MRILAAALWFAAALAGCVMPVYQPDDQDASQPHGKLLPLGQMFQSGTKVRLIFIHGVGDTSLRCVFQSPVFLRQAMDTSRGTTRRLLPAMLGSIPAG